jgi:urate oxidase
VFVVAVVHIILFLSPSLSFSPSDNLQKTMYDMSQVIFSRIPKINAVEIQMPNIHYYIADLSKLQLPNQGEVRVLERLKFDVVVTCSTWLKFCSFYVLS